MCFFLNIFLQLVYGNDVIAIEAGDMIGNRPISGGSVSLYKLKSTQVFDGCSAMEFRKSFIIKQENYDTLNLADPAFVLDVLTIRRRWSLKRQSLIPIFKPGN